MSDTIRKGLNRGIGAIRVGWNRAWYCGWFHSWNHGIFKWIREVIEHGLSVGARGFMRREGGDLGVEVGHLWVAQRIKAIEHTIEIEGTFHDIVAIRGLLDLRSSRSTDLFRDAVHEIDLSCDWRLVSLRVVRLRAVRPLTYALPPGVSRRGARLR